MSSVERVLAELTLGPPLDARSLAASCERHGVSEADAAALLEVLPRLAVYRELVRGNLLEAMRLSIPRTIARLGAVFDGYFDRFLVEQGPRTHYLRDVTTELLDFCEPLWGTDSRVPAYALELARHEALHILVSALPTPPVGHVATGLSLDQGVQLSSALRLVRYHHAVHELPELEEDRSVPAPRRVSLLVYRSPEHDVRYLELSPLAYGIVWRLVQGEALGVAVREAAAGENVMLSEQVLAGSAQLLADLAARGVVWGARPPANQPGATPKR